MTRHVNVGTIGHIDHGKTTLTQALVKVLGEEMASKVVIVDESNAAEVRRMNLLCDDLDVSPMASGRPRNAKRNAKRKADRKARMQAAQRRAFFGEPAPSNMP